MALFGPRDLFLSFAKDGSLTEPYCSQAKSPIKRCPHAGPKAKLFFFFPFLSSEEAILGATWRQTKINAFYAGAHIWAWKRPLHPALHFFRSLMSSPRFPFVWPLGTGKTFFEVSSSIEYLHLTTSEEIPALPELVDHIFRSAKGCSCRCEVKLHLLRNLSLTHP